MSQKSRMLAGKLYLPFDSELASDNKKARELTRQFNTTEGKGGEFRKSILKELFKKTGNNLYIEPPFRTDYGCHTSIGENFYANYDCIIIDVCPVNIGNNVFFGPRVCIYTATHPIDATVRNSLIEYGKPVTIGNDVWIGGNTVVNPGVTIGSNVVIGSGSVVVKSIPDNVIAAGNPAKVIREISDSDKVYWEEMAQNYREEQEP
ncbi:maltose O-acetyltransferase [Alteromonas sp. I10]|uniref:sugar O-acetyltransferase n=1 Tax=Alteromonas TaxID=226 RepID=UPI000D768C16|nr:MULTISPECIES: sugar O-acetyltransferase [Alteromonas]PXW71720.1 maltose O-acetyltransferase [Alteromonas sp. I10]